MAKMPLPITNYQQVDGNPVANGYLIVWLNRDGRVAGNHIQFNATIVPLDSNGNISGTHTFWPNADIIPSGTYYIVDVHSQLGQLITNGITMEV